MRNVGRSLRWGLRCGRSAAVAAMQADVQRLQGPVPGRAANETFQTAAGKLSGACTTMTVTELACHAACACLVR